MTAKGDNCDTTSGKPDENGCEEDGYFTSYSDLDIHELMLKDKPRTLAYKNFIEGNKKLFKDKVVVDVGAGTGILSLFAAAAGAKKVYAVEASDIAAACNLVVQQNCFENVIEVIHQKVEDFVLPNNVKADILISEWMGFYLFHESMLDSIIHARDSLLRADGLILPAKATLFLVPVNMDAMYKDKFEFWKDVYGFDYSPLIPSVIVKSLQSPTISTVTSTSCLCDPQEVITLDLHSVTLKDVQSFSKDFNFEIPQSCTAHGFVSWFDVVFEPGISESAEGKHLTLSTSPYAEETHWKQTVFNLPAPLLIDKGDVVKCRMELAQDSKNKRHYNISIELLEVPELADMPSGDANGTDDVELDVGEDHPTPCNCDAPRCKIIKALIEKYDEQDEMMKQEGVVDITREELDEAVDISDSLDI